MSTVSVRRLDDADVPAMRALNALFADVFGDQEAYASNPPSDDYLTELLAKDHVAVLVAEEHGRVLGGLVAYEFDKLEQARREIYIYDLAVDPSYRRQGIASALIAGLQKIAEKRGAWAVFVQADHGDEAAIGLYTKLGHREEVLHFDIDPVVG